MSDFAEQLLASPAAAHGAMDEHNTTGQQEQPQPDQLAGRRSRAAALCQEVQQRFNAAATASQGTIAHRHRVDHYGRVTATLSWREPGPARDLTIYVNPLEGMVEWSWVVGRALKQRQRSDALAFAHGRLNELLLLFADQEAWSKPPPPF